MYTYNDLHSYQILLQYNCSVSKHIVKIYTIYIYNTCSRVNIRAQQSHGFLICFIVPCSTEVEYRGQPDSIFSDVNFSKNVFSKKLYQLAQFQNNYSTKKV